MTRSGGPAPSMIEGAVCRRLVQADERMVLLVLEQGNGQV
jgi:hypothetical protein